MDTREVILLRLPSSLKNAMRERALANKRSVTKEIEFALERYAAKRAQTTATDADGILVGKSASQ